MTNTEIAIDFVLRNEDAKLSGVIVRDNNGARVRFGVNERFHPKLTDAGFYGTMEHDEALDLAREVYADEYAAPLKIDALNSDVMACKVLDIAANASVIQAAHLLQRSLNGCGAQLNEDGIVGSKTVEAANAVDLEEWKAAFVTALAAFRAAVIRAARVPITEEIARVWEKRDAEFPTSTTEASNDTLDHEAEGMAESTS